MDNRLDKAAALRRVLESEDYKETIGKWFETGKKIAYNEFLEASNSNEMFAAQGHMKAWHLLDSQIFATLSSEQNAIKALKKLNKEEQDV